MEPTKQTTMKQVREHLVHIRKHDKAVDKLIDKNHWFRRQNVNEKYYPVLEEMYHMSELAMYWQNFAMTIIYNHEMVDFEKVKKSKLFNLG